MKVLTTSWVEETEKRIGTVYVLYKNGKRLLTIGNYYDNRHLWCIGLNGKLSFLFNCEKQFRKPKNCMRYVENILEKWVSTWFFETNNISEEDWIVLKSRIECRQEYGMDSDDYKKACLAINFPFKKIPRVINKVGEVTKDVLYFRLEKGF